MHEIDGRKLVLAVYRGDSDAQIAEAFGLDIIGAKRWRKQVERDMPTAPPRHQGRPPVRPHIESAFEAGLGDIEIRHRFKLNAGTVKQYRRRWIRERRELLK